MSYLNHTSVLIVFGFSSWKIKWLQYKKINVKDWDLIDCVAVVLNSLGWLMLYVLQMLHSIQNVLEFIACVFKGM
jgi:hypothetical protein